MLFNGLVGSLTALVFVAYPPVIERMVGGAGLVGYAPWIGLTVFLWIFGSFLEIIPIANGEMRVAMIFIICVQLTRMILLAGAALLFGTLASLIWIWVRNSSGCGSDFHSSGVSPPRFKGFWREFDRQLLWRQLSYAMPLGLSGLLWIMQTDLHNYIISYRFGPAIFAVYAVGVVQLCPLMGLLQEATTGRVLISGRESGSRSRRTKRGNYRCHRPRHAETGCRLLSIYALMMIVGREFISFLFTNRYSASWPIFAVNLTLLPFTILLQDPLFRAFASERFFLLRLRVAVLIALVIAILAATSRFWPGGRDRRCRLRQHYRTRKLRPHVSPGFCIVQRSDLPLLADVGKLALASLIAALATALVRSFLLGVRAVHHPCFAARCSPPSMPRPFCGSKSQPMMRRN